MVVLDVSPSLDSQITSKSEETQFIMSVAKRASQRLKNRVNTTSVLQEKPQKTKESKVKDPLQEKRGRPMSHHPPKGSATSRSPLVRPQGIDWVTLMIGRPR